MIFGWLKRRRRGRILAEEFPSGWLLYLQQNVAAYERLEPEAQARLQGLVQVFVAEKAWEGCGGFELSDEAKVTIAGQACLLLLGIEHDYYRNLQTVIVYPSGFSAPGRSSLGGGVVAEGPQARLGEAHHRGPVVLAWDAVRHGGRNPDDGRNLVLHEFAHKLDLLDGLADGTPLLPAGRRFREWVEVMTREYQALCDKADRGRATVLDHYGATNAPEFFAVATEAFFEKPLQLQRKHEALYGVLRDFYRQDPAARAVVAAA